MPGLCSVSGLNNLQQCIPIATPDTTTFGATNDFYRIGVRDYSRKLHTDLPATKLRGYVQLDGNNSPVGANQYLGPMILAQRNRPVRMLFKNLLGTGPSGKLFLPVDTSFMGAGMGPDGTAYSQNRAVIHLHGGNTPWISDGTPHQWITPAGEATNYKKGVSFNNVPDMIGTGKPIPSPSLADGLATYYFTNQQSGRLMWYHDHAYGLTRLNVYAGEVAPFLLYDPAQESALATATVPGAITNTPDFAHLIPLVVQDKTFVPDATSRGQLNVQDPTWDVANWGGKGTCGSRTSTCLTKTPPTIPARIPWAGGIMDYGSGHRRIRVRSQPTANLIPARRRRILARCVQGRRYLPACRKVTWIPR